ncbi:hypothetical protein GCM10012285_16000 [Streptomyces kronopolitis]|uniref:Uncharacterized protein n=1 Tax=Streptomyces kronopolitis TaxID=1612435 RepID=A0ABQ2J7H4_9ACTN|nr:hypothetical protein GCM10012285_16000 [Streptomyces kronopolitis]GLW17098.1 hypothetical protein Stsp01_38410 [Streptomyces sp. NBRC 13847]
MLRGVLRGTAMGYDGHGGTIRTGVLNGACIGHRVIVPSTAAGPAGAYPGYGTGDAPVLSGIKDEGTVTVSAYGALTRSG